MIQIRYGLLISSIIAVILSSLVSIVPIGIANQAEVSAMFPTLFTPATFTFSIWSIIYLSWIVFGIFVALGNTSVSPKNIALLGSAQILSSLWLIPSQFLYTATSLTVMMGVLYLLLLSFFISNNEDKYFKYTLELFLAWIIIASIANLHLVLVDYNIYFYSLFITQISILIAVTIFAIGVLRYHATIGAFVFLWASFGIIIGQENNITHLTAGAGFCIIVFLLGWSHRAYLNEKVVSKYLSKK